MNTCGSGNTHAGLAAGSQVGLAGADTSLVCISDGNVIAISVTTVPQSISSTNIANRNNNGTRVGRIVTIATPMKMRCSAERDEGAVCF